MSDTTRAYLKVIFSVIVWGTSFIATKIALMDISPSGVIFLRFGIGVIILAAANAVTGSFLLPRKRDLLYLILLGFLGIAFHQWLQSTGLVTAQASTTAWIVATTPIFMAILGRIFLKEVLTRSQVFGILLAAVGVLAVISNGDFSSLALGKFGSPGDILILISAVNWAGFSILSNRGLKRYPASAMMFYVMIFGWLLILAFLLPQNGFVEFTLLSMNGWLSILFLGVACSGLAYIFWYDGLQTIPSSQVGSFLYLEPVVAVAVASILLGEDITAASVLGGITILFGVWLVNRSR